MGGWPGDSAAQKGPAAGHRALCRASHAPSQSRSGAQLPPPGAWGSGLSGSQETPAGGQEDVPGCLSPCDSPGLGTAATLQAASAVVSLYLLLSSPQRVS